MSDKRPGRPKPNCVSWRPAAPRNSKAPAPPNCCAGPKRTSAASTDPAVGRRATTWWPPICRTPCWWIWPPRYGPAYRCSFWTPAITSSKPSAPATRSNPSTTSGFSTSRRSTRVAEQDELLGKDLFARDPGECCRLRKVVPLGKTLRGYSAWVTGLRRVEAPTRANAPADQLRRGVQAGEDQPAGGVDRRGHAGLHRRARRAGQSACLRRLSVDRLCSVHGQAS